MIYGRTELMQHGVWVTGDVINDPQQGLLFRADKPVEGNTKEGLVYLAVPEDLAKTFGPMCYRAAQRRISYACTEHFCRIPAPKTRVTLA